MTKLILTVLAAALLAPAADPRVEKEILAALDNWRQAVMTKDRALFDKVLHADLTYGHSNGLVENKVEAIRHIIDGKAEYEAINFSETAVRIHGNSAIVTGKVDYVQKTEGRRSTTNLSVLSVWIKGSRGWQMAGRQSTRLGP